ncbi:unnamed protein product [Caenorhabditis nigoni]
MTASNATNQLQDAEERNWELQGELVLWRSGAYKLSCNCDRVDVDVFEDSDMSEERIMEEQEHVEVPFNIFDRSISPMEAQSNHYWDGQFDGFIAHEDNLRI